MKILLLGKNGQVGWELQRSLAPLGIVFALGSEDTQDTACGNLTLTEPLRRTLQGFAPDIIVNAAAYTAVDQAEHEPELAQKINGEALQTLATEAKRFNAWLIHYSTDYVFDGSGRKPWKENDHTNPLNEYGRSKLAGEVAITAAQCKHLILRTSWVYASRGSNFAKTMLRLAQERDALKVIDDQVGAPTGADLIADITAHLIRSAINQPNVSGIYHLTAGGETSWYDYARYVLTCAEKQGIPLRATSANLEAVPTSAFPTAAARPANSRLNTNKLQSTFNLHLPHWEIGVKRMLTEILES